MLAIKDLTDLRKYLKVRMEMARRQITTKNTVAAGIVYGFEESIKAVDSLLARPKPEKPVDQKCDVCLEAIDPDARNYQSTADSVVCEACCRKAVDRAKEARLAASRAKETDVIPAGAVTRYLFDQETIGG